MTVRIRRTARRRFPFRLLLRRTVRCGSRSRPPSPGGFAAPDLRLRESGASGFIGPEHIVPDRSGPAVYGCMSAPANGKCGRSVENFFRKSFAGTVKNPYLCSGYSDPEIHELQTQHSVGAGFLAAGRPLGFSFSGGFGFFVLLGRLFQLPYFFVPGGLRTRAPSSPSGPGFGEGRNPSGRPGLPENVWLHDENLLYQR